MLCASDTSRKGGTYCMTTSEAATYQQVLTQAEDLSPADKLRLLEAFAAQLHGAIDDVKPHKRHHITEFRGIGHASWDGTEAQEYVNQERDAWDG